MTGTNLWQADVPPQKPTNLSSLQNIFRVF